MNHTIVGWDFCLQGCSGGFAYFFCRFFCTLNGQGTAALMTAGAQELVCLWWESWHWRESPKSTIPPSFISAVKISINLITTLFIPHPAPKVQSSTAEHRRSCSACHCPLSAPLACRALLIHREGAKVGGLPPSTVKRLQGHFYAPAQCCFVFINPIVFPLPFHASVMGQKMYVLS